MMRPNRAWALGPDQILVILQELGATGTVVQVTAAMTFLALEALPKHGLSFWDALIWTAAKENGISRIDTEDFQDGRDVEGVFFVNPFRAVNPPTV